MAWGFSYLCLCTRNSVLAGSHSILYMHVLIRVTDMKYNSICSLFLQGQTMQMMYEIIAHELKSANIKNVHPTDYLNFYCLGNREKRHGEGSSDGHMSSNCNVVIMLSLKTYLIHCEFRLFLFQWDKSNCIRKKKLSDSIGRFRWKKHNPNLHDLIIH